jgi:putative ABC transport system permease protein
MKSNYIKIILRNFTRNKVFSLINLSGLAIGIAVFILIILYVGHELSYDKFHKNADRIYKLAKVDGSFSTVPPLANILKNQFPEIEHIIRVSSDKAAYAHSDLENNKTISSIKLDNVLYADSSFFDTFSYSVISGNLQTALYEPDAIVLTESSVKRLFGNLNVIGRKIKYNALFPSKNMILTIKAIIEDPKDNSTLRSDGIISFLSLNKIKPNGINVDENWRDGYCNTYILLRNNTLYSAFKKKITEFMPLLEK